MNVQIGNREAHRGNGKRGLGWIWFLFAVNPAAPVQQELAESRQRVALQPPARADQLEAQLAAAQQQAAQLRTELGVALGRQTESCLVEEKMIAQTHQIAMLQRQLADKITELEGTRAATTPVEQERDALRVAALRAEQELNESRERFAEATAGRDDWERRCNRVADEARHAQLELRARNERLEKLSAALTCAEQEREALRVAMGSASAAEKRLIELRERFSEAVAGRDDWERRCNRATAEANRIQLELLARDERLETLTATLRRTEQERDALRVATGASEQQLNELSERFGESIAGRDDWERRCDRASAEARRVQLELLALNEKLESLAAALTCAEQERDALRVAQKCQAQARRGRTAASTSG